MRNIVFVLVLTVFRAEAFVVKHQSTQLESQICQSCTYSSQDAGQIEDLVYVVGRSEGDKQSLMKSCEIGRRDFGMHRHPTLGVKKMHTGHDLKAPPGTPIYAPKDGVIVTRETQGGYGKTVEVQLEDGITILLAHLSKFPSAKLGHKVRQGDIIGYVGETGRATGPHLHLEARNSDGQLIDPRNYFSDQEYCANYSLIEEQDETRKI